MNKEKQEELLKSFTEFLTEYINDFISDYSSMDCFAEDYNLSDEDIDFLQAQQYIVGIDENDSGL